MTFYERYARIAEEQDLEPCSQRAADMFGCTKATISSWNVKNTTPKGETVAIMADKLRVSADFLLGRTDDPTDRAAGPKIVRTNNAQRPPAKADAAPGGISPALATLLQRLDSTDLLKIEGVVQGMLMADKYSSALSLNAAHVRTDILPDKSMVAHDDSIMDDSDF